MLQSRRGFLIGIGSLLTTAFVADARSFIRTNGRPLLARPQQVLQTLYWYENGDDRYLLTLGEWTNEAPPAPTWREFFISEGIPHHIEADIEQIWSEHGVWPEHYDETLCERYWQSRYEIEDSPSAKAHRLLRDIDLGPDRATARGPVLEFHEGAHPGDSSYWVNAKDELSLSLLQARLIDLKMPINIEEGG